jgi:peptidoglycan/LPS O-acetylase OafA/YrhL
MKGKTETGGSHEANLDFVRTLAVLMVVVSHLAFFFGVSTFSFLDPVLFGKLGVIIFFVHSGIVNMLSIERHVNKYGERRLFRAFMTRRCFRIYPLSVVVVSVVFLMKLPVSLLAHHVAAIGQNARAEFLPSLFLVQNFLRFDQILSPLWSLPYEIQIYCLFPVAYLAIRRLRSTKTMVFAWSLLAMVDHVITPHFVKHANLGHFVTVPDFLSYSLLFGAGLYAFKEMQTSRRMVPFWALPALITIVCLMWCLSYGDTTKCVFVTFCLGLALPYIKGCSSTALNRVCGWVAKYSYGIYLLHFPAIWLAFVRCGHLPMVEKICIFVLATLGTSVVAYHVIEHPMIVIGNRVAAAISKNEARPKGQAAAATAGAIG